jgi:hypothetical protein
MVSAFAVATTPGGLNYFEARSLDEGSPGQPSAVAAPTGCLRLRCDAVQDQRTLYFGVRRVRGCRHALLVGASQPPWGKTAWVDSFKGLPEAWGSHQKRHFDTGGGSRRSTTHA